MAQCERLSDFWRLVASRVSTMPMTHRPQIADVCGFVSDTVYKWPNPQMLSWIRDFEESALEPDGLAGYARVIGWGAGSLFRASHRRVPHRLEYTIDSNPEAWNTVVDGVPVVSPSRLDDEDPRAVAVIVFSCAFDEIAASVAARGPFRVFRVEEAAGRRRFRPLEDLVAYFEEVERHYPVLFAPDGAHAGAQDGSTGLPRGSSGNGRTSP